ncbi:PPC domain-containing DNA-binding protein [Zongyangia hominis]|uniref:DNA-binding protein n=1 Tax=Zongyangia hominis TaxID=2763677 RepID=A0A926IBJ5_9FIRM|nr:PPC domain-containing DNA-binding protein [Zongyangia hominis]MBC8570348.1 DNA-binding protein [Zongyangia hominis]
MLYRVFGDTIVARLDKGEEVIAAIKEICVKEGVKAGSITGLGAVNHVVIGVFDTEEQKFCPNVLDGVYEIASVTGNVSEMDGETYLHLHATFGDREGRVFGGHLSEAVISATGEIYIHTVDGHVGRTFSPEIGLNLIDF